MIKEYWNLTGQEPFLSITWEADFSQACRFCRMLRNHKNFHFTQIPEKTNDVIFLSPKTMFVGHFWTFLVVSARWGFFPKNLALSHITRYGPLTPCYVSGKTNVSILRNLTDRQDRQMDGWMDGWTEGRMDGPYFIGPFRLRPGVQK